MKIFFTVLLSLTFIGCANDYPVNNIPPKKISLIADEPQTKQEFRKEDHRYDSRYQNFDYNRLGYSNNNGFYYGYFDDKGYFFNNTYFIYDDDYTYDDRYYRRGFFSLDAQHIRPYIHHHDNNWNQVHHYAKPNQYVGQYFYYEIDPRPRFRVYHRDADLGSRNLSYQNSKN